MCYQQRKLDEGNQEQYTPKHSKQGKRERSTPGSGKASAKMQKEFSSRMNDEY